MNDTTTPTTAFTDLGRLGRRVFFMLDAGTAQEIIRKRREAGITARTGNEPREGQVVPGIIVADWFHPLTAKQLPDAELTEKKLAQLNAEREAASSVNIQLFLDGNDSHWVTSRQVFDPEKMDEPKGHWTYGVDPR